MLDNLIDADVYKAVAEAVSPEFAFSYLVKAKQEKRVIIPHTVTGWERLTQNVYAMKAIHKLAFTVKKPPLWRPDTETMPSRFAA